MAKNIFFTMLASVVLTACSSNSKEVVGIEDTITLANHSTFQLTSLKLKPKRVENLRIITRGHNASAVAGDITKTIFCNPFSLFNLIGTCKADIYTHSKEDLMGEITPIPNISISYAYPKYKELLKQNIAFSKPINYSQIPLYFVHGDNYLVYDNEHYKLVAQFGIAVRFQKGDLKDSSQFSFQNTDFQCQEEVSGFTKEQWQADNYALAVTEGKKLIDRCFQRLDKTHFENIGKRIEDFRSHYL
ncbi:hypothetical protein JFL47_06000 [Haemophilus haemoglobinophilus]|nr:hypothetical protein [Canicola haemoglobinophilus]